jgi:hypothetical protein
MVHHLDKVIEIAKKLRKLAKKVDNQDVQSLIVDLNLSVADLKMQVAEAQQSDPQPQTTGAAREQRAKSTTPMQDRTPVTSGAYPLAPTPMHRA